MPPVTGGLKRGGAPFNGGNKEEMRQLFPSGGVAGGGHGGGLRSVTAAAAPAQLGWRWKKEADQARWAKRLSGPAGCWADWAGS
jgi:hypothetical protein